MKADGPISQKALTEARHCLLKVPSFARRKPSAVTVQRAGKAESKHALIWGNSKDAAAETTKLTMGKENLKGLGVPKKKLSEAKCKTIPVGLQKIPNKATVGGSTSGGKGIASKKKGAVTSTAAYQACDLAGNLPQKNPPENIKYSGYKIKVSKSHTSRILEANASTLPFALQQNEVSGSVNASQQVACTDTTFDNSFNGQMLSPETEKEMKRRKHPRTQYEYNASEVKTSEEELEYSLKKARPQKKVGPALRVEITEADNVIDSISGAIPDAEIKVHNPKKRNSIAVDITTVGEKVRDCHARGNLKSLTVPELKSFLSANKVKVGGKKEELIQRIIDLLSN